MKGFSENVCYFIGTSLCCDNQIMEFHINAKLREICKFNETLFASSGNVILSNPKAIQDFVFEYNKTIKDTTKPELFLKAGQLNAMGLIDEIFHYVFRLYRKEKDIHFFFKLKDELVKEIGEQNFLEILNAFVQEFPSREVYKKQVSAESWLEAVNAEGIPNSLIALEELILLHLANENPAFQPFYPLFDDSRINENPYFKAMWNHIKEISKNSPSFGPEDLDIISLLKAPVEYAPFDLKGQLEYIKNHWGFLLGEWLTRLLSGLDLIAEEEKAGWSGGFDGGSFEMYPYEFGDISKEYERFSPDREWMPNVVLMAKSVLVWLSQLSKKYNREINRLDQIPNEELEFLASCGFNGLWLIGIWERSPASKRIKQICGNPEAAASAYSLDDYDIAHSLGGWEALGNLRTRAWHYGIRLASDMVPNHTGMDSKWVVEKPHLFIQSKDSPFPGYDFQGENLSHDGRISIFLENKYYNKTDCAVVFKRVDNASGDTRYIYHGNDGTGLPWNDTAQIDFLNPEAREEVIQKILHVARNFPIIRFDAAMVLAKKHIQRLWYPEPGAGGDIASRSWSALNRDEFERRIPEEFWREVVDRCAQEIPDTLLLAEAFWMMEGYFVRTLGMHRVYNSAFMNMLKREDNVNYRNTIKNTIEFDPEILKRYVNFMNNPDEETAVAQFGKDDKYFGVCTMMVAMPGLPMFGHGQIEGFEEKYGMEYQKAYKNEMPDEHLLYRHRREIFPLMKKRYLFAGVENFCLYDFYNDGSVNENVFAWSNRCGQERALILYNNVYQQTSGWIKMSAASAIKQVNGDRVLVQKSLGEGLNLQTGDACYCIMQEQGSGLWYIRKNIDIYNQGFYASLQGFQTQVFLNMYEVEDTKEGLYASLHGSLNGKGISDIFMGIQNIYLKDLYAGLSDFVSEDYLGYIKKVFAKKEIENEDTFLLNLKKVAINFFTIFDTFTKGNFKASSIFIGLDTNEDAEKELVKDNGKKSSAKKVKKEQDFAFNKVDTEEVWTEFLKKLETFKSLVNVLVQDHSKNTKKAKKILPEVIESIFSKPCFIEAMGAILVLDSLKIWMPEAYQGVLLGKIIDLWSIDKKIAELFVSYGVDAFALQDILKNLREMYAFEDLNGVTNSTFIEKFIVYAFNSTNLKSYVGIHDWDGVLWFNKEAVEYQLVLLLMYLVLSGYSFKDSKKEKGKEKIITITDTIELLERANDLCKTSEYKVAKILELTNLEKEIVLPKKKANKNL